MSELRYSIKDLENFTKIKAHTIRIWEQRYGLLTPKRTDTNIRYYNESDLKKILNINLLYGSGRKISKIASLTDNEIRNASKALIISKETDNQSEIDTLTMDILSFNGSKILAQLNTALSEGSMEQLYESTILPFFEKIGQLWQVNSVDIIHEHYFSNIFREFLISNISEIPQPNDPEKTAVLFLHDTEEHEFSVLLYYYLLKKAGYSCHYLGQKIPIREVQGFLDQKKPKIIVTTFTAKISEKNFNRVAEKLEQFAQNTKVIISGSQLNDSSLSWDEKLVHINSIEQLKALL